MPQQKIKVFIIQHFMETFI